MARRLLSFLLVLSTSVAASAQPLALPGLPRPRLGELLQRFVSEQFGKSFRDLGVERDFDHGHLLFDKEGRPVAVLYHTQEDTAASAKGPRSWLQWVSDGRVEEAAHYARSRYPDTAAWNLFVKVKLPEFERRGTVTDQMLDPARLDVDAAKTIQWEFTRAACGAGPDQLQVKTPDGGVVCLALSAS